MPKKLLYLLLIFCFINPLFSQLNDEKTYFFKDKNDKEGQIVYSKARTDGLNWISYRFDSDTRPNKQKVAQIVAKKDKFNIKIAGFGTKFIAEYQNDYAFTAYSKYSDGSIYEMGRMLKRKTNLSRCSPQFKEDRTDCEEDRYFNKIKLKPKHSKKMPVYNDIIVKYGEWKGYHSNGTLSYKVRYRNGFPQSGYTFFPSGYVESFLSGPETITYKESDKKSVVTGKNYERAKILVIEKHNSKFGDKAKEITVLSKDNLVSVKNSEGYYEEHYTNFEFTGDYNFKEKKSSPWYVGQFQWCGFGSCAAINIQSFSSVYLILDESTGWMPGSLSRAGGSKYIWRHDSVDLNDIEIPFYLDSSSEEIVTGGGRVMSRQTSRYNSGTRSTNYKVKCSSKKCEIIK